PVEGVTPLRDRLAAIAHDASMQVCGGGCMGFINVGNGLRAIGYLEPDPVPAGPVALITHSGSVFSAMLRARRGIGYTLVVSSGQELVTTTASYVEYALSQSGTKVVALVLETIRDAEALRAAFDRAADADVPVILLPVGVSERGRAMVSAHSGAVSGGVTAWEALADAHGLHLVSELGELLDTVELFAAGRRARPAHGNAATGFAAVLDSGAERALVADIASEVGVGFADLSAATIASLTERLDPGLVATNPLDVWGNGSDTEERFVAVMDTLATDPGVRALALAVDLVPELDGDESYPNAARRVSAATTLPVAVMSHVAAALDTEAAAELRRVGIPVLEGTRSGMRAVGHLLQHAPRRGLRVATTSDPGRRRRALGRVSEAVTMTAVEGFALLDDYGIATAPVIAAGDDEAVLAAASVIGYPVVLKTAAVVAHKTELGGVVTGLGSEAQVRAAYRDLATRLGPDVIVCRQLPSGVELLLGAVRDANLGMLLVLGVGGVLVEQVGAAAASLPPVDVRTARRLVERTLAHRLLTEPRSGEPADVDVVIETVVRFSTLVVDLADHVDAIEINPLICSVEGATAADIHVDPRH
ncbi:MAG: acetate--CoA ligase family protein, partial [Frankiaceae bacterium]|nr:acetate--CoA ligase family protein [Frankiaceae bacterium]